MITILVLALAAAAPQPNGVKKPPVDSTKPLQPPSSQPGNDGVKPYNPGMPDFEHPKVPNPEKPIPAPKSK